jgi:hypothetical protein
VNELTADQSPMFPAPSAARTRQYQGVWIDMLSMINSVPFTEPLYAVQTGSKSGRVVTS